MKAIGIDLGGTNIKVAVVHTQKREYLNKQAFQLMQSWVVSTCSTELLLL